MSATEQITSEQAETRQTCSVCYRSLPLDQFRFRSRAENSRHRDCRQCAAAGEKRRRDIRRLKRIDRFNRAIVKKTDARRMSKLVAKMIDTYGNLDGFVTAWRGASDTAAAKGLNCSVLRSFRVLFELMNAAAELEREAAASGSDAVASMGPEELVEAQIEATVALIRERPQVAVLAARRLGWEVPASV